MAADAEASPSHYREWLKENLSEAAKAIVFEAGDDNQLMMQYAGRTLGDLTASKGSVGFLQSLFRMTKVNLSESHVRKVHAAVLALKPDTITGLEEKLDHRIARAGALPEGDGTKEGDDSGSETGKKGRPDPERVTPTSKSLGKQLDTVMAQQGLPKTAGEGTPLPTSSVAGSKPQVKSTVSKTEVKGMIATAVDAAVTTIKDDILEINPLRI